MKYRTHRYNTEYPIDMRTPVGCQKCKVLDVHNAGARVTGMQHLRRGDKVRMKILSQDINAVVQWVSGMRAGISFRPQISDELVDLLRYRQDKSNRTHPGAIGFKLLEMR